MASMAHGSVRSLTLLVASLIRLQYKHVFGPTPNSRLSPLAPTDSVQLRSVVLQELSGLLSESSTQAVNTGEVASLRRVEDTVHVCARGLLEILGAPEDDRERCRSGCLECASTVLRAFAGAPPNPADTRQHAVRLLERVDQLLATRENSVLSGEKTYALDFDVLEQIAAVDGGSSATAEDGAEVMASDWQDFEQASVVLLLIAARAITNIDSGGLAAAAPQSAPNTLLRQLRVIVDQVDRSTRELSKKSQRNSDRTGRLLSEVLRMGLAKRVVVDLTRTDAPARARRDALTELRPVWHFVAVRELEIVRILDGELAHPNYPQQEALTKTVLAGAANVLVGGRLLDRPGDFLLLDALIHQHDGLAHAVEFYTAALRGHPDVQTQTQLIVLTRLLRAVAALWIIHARLAQETVPPRRV